jgi:hypothetical protein
MQDSPASGRTPYHRNALRLAGNQIDLLSSVLGIS